MSSYVIFSLNMEIVISLTADNTKIGIIDENKKEALTNLSALAKRNVRMACQQSNEREP